MLEEYHYHCTLCGHKLNQGNDVHFLVALDEGEKHQLKLSKVPGVFGHKSDHTLSIKDGDVVDFYCPKCESNLRSETRPEFVEIQLVVAKTREYPLFISPICGDRASYILREGQLNSYGNDFFSILSNDPKAKAG